MQCIICKFGETSPGTTTVTLERGNTTLVIKSVPRMFVEIAAKDM